MDCPNCNKKNIRASQQCLICTKEICINCGKYGLCGKCIGEFPKVTSEIRKTLRNWGFVLFCSVIVGIFSIAYWVMTTFFIQPMITLEFWGENTISYLLLITLSVTIALSLLSVYLMKKIPVMLTELEKLRYGKTKSQYVKKIKMREPSGKVSVYHTNSRTQSSDKPAKGLKALLSKEEYKPRAHNFVCCKMCGKLNPKKNHHCNECGAEMPTE